MPLEQPKPIQDVAPPGGFKPIQYKRNMPKGGPSSLVMAIGSIGMFSFGLYKIIMANRTRRGWSLEEKDIRLSILPFLTAESDLQQAYLKDTLNAKETVLMADVDGWKVGASVYKTRYMLPMDRIGIANELKGVFGEHF